MFHPRPEACSAQNQLGFHHRQPPQELGLRPNGHQESLWVCATEKESLVSIDVLRFISQTGQTRQEPKYRVLQCQQRRECTLLKTTCTELDQGDRARRETWALLICHHLLLFSKTNIKCCTVTIPSLQISTSHISRSHGSDFRTRICQTKTI